MSKPTKFTRRATCQRCLRTDDLDKVGKTSSHHTFFEMLGNFSFGDYFKEEAIGFAWKFLTEELNLAQEKLWVSVYREDEEAYQVWQDKVKVSANRIVRLGAKENFWPANAPEEGPNGPCGPCSEIFYDQGKDIGCGSSECDPGCDCGRFVEIWNLVFTQFERKGKNKLEPLPNKNIDTGMGLERMAAVLQGKTSNFEIDIFEKIIESIGNLAGHSPNLSSPACKVIADHIRAVTFAIADGVLPSNDQRGYVIRKLIRRAVWHGKALGIKKAYLYRIVPTVAKVMRAAYPELEKNRAEIAQVVKAEEERFHRTLERASKFAKDVIAGLKKQGKNELPGKEMFKLYDTYGLPKEELKKLVSSKGFKLDEQGFAQELELQRKTSRSASVIAESVFVANLVSKFKLKPTKFVGDKNYSVKTKVCALFKDDEPAQEAKEAEEVKIVLESTPFYGESGGQIGDRGVIKTKSATVQVLDTHRIEQVYLHSGKVTSGIIKLNQKVEAKIDLPRRENITHNHTATHLLQAALRKALGEYLRQAGSWVGPDRLRFDFTHFQALTPREITRVEELVNNQIKQNKKLAVLKMSFEKAQKSGALAFFGEKYQEKVRVIKIGDLSSELCGGTHVSATGELGRFKIISESSVASGIRRIEALTGRAAAEALAQEGNQLKKLGQAFGARQEELPERIEELLSKVKGLDKKLERSRLENFNLRIGKIIKEAKEISGVKIITQRIASAQMNLLRLMADSLRQKLDPAVVVLACSVAKEKVLIVCALSPKARSLGLDATKIIRAISVDLEGSGGGRSDFAQAGGRKPRGLEQALSKVEAIVKKELK